MRILRRLAVLFGFGLVLLSIAGPTYAWGDKSKCDGGPGTNTGVPGWKATDTWQPWAGHKQHMYVEACFNHPDCTISGCDPTKFVWVSTPNVYFTSTGEAPNETVDLTRSPWLYDQNCDQICYDHLIYRFSVHQCAGVPYLCNDFTFAGHVKDAGIYQCFVGGACDTKDGLTQWQHY